MELVWDQTGERRYEAGVDHGVLFLPDETGQYVQGVAWNGLTTVTESPSGAEASPQFADNIKYLNLISAEEFGATIEAFTYPDEFAECDGTARPSPGVSIGQQGRRLFGLCYRTLVGNDVDGTDSGYKLHLIYGAQAAPSEKAYGTINDSPEALAFSWEVTTSPVQVTGYKPSASLTIDSTKESAADMAALEAILFGTPGDDPRMPLPDEVIAIFGAGITDVSVVNYANQPTFNDTTNVITVPAVVGVQWQIDGEDVADGPQPALAADQTVEVRAAAEPGYNVVGDDTWTYTGA